MDNNVLNGNQEGSTIDQSEDTPLGRIPDGGNQSDVIPEVQPVQDAVLTPRRSGRERYTPVKFKDFEMG
ncbi:hypothetical protein DPMN_035808 [Dreissena polymorpha]|uniref:Uncharacterized protein n=1 Tax=Dreissena polymorpha TaxID=45954 RepID=A0A9D4MAB0_DREPO|nr:hypothetical protein DPMN_035808 [Dreissena polymorpha]